MLEKRTNLILTVFLFGIIFFYLVNFVSSAPTIPSAYCNAHGAGEYGYCNPSSNTCNFQGTWQCTERGPCQTYCCHCDTWLYTPTYFGDGRTCLSDFECAPLDNAPIGSASKDAAGTYPYISTNGWAQDNDCSGLVTPTSNNCPLDIHIYVDGPAGSGADFYTTTANLVVGPSNKDNYIWNVPSQYLNAQSHTAYFYALGKDASGINNGNNLFLGTTTFNVAPTCTSFTYNSWSTCSYGSQTTTVASSSPSGCTGGNPVTTRQCTSPEGGNCANNNQCNYGLYCKSSTGKCTDPNNEHLACSNNQCVLVSGAGSNACSIDANCQVCSYSTSSSCSGGIKTTTTSVSPNGCIGSPSSSTTTCTYGCSSDGINCNSAPVCTYTTQYSCSANTRTKSYISSPSNCVGTIPSDSGSSTTCTYGCSSDGINCNTGSYGSSCASSAQCASGLICSSNVCKVSVDNSCTSTSECAQGLYCKSSTGKCTDPNNEHLACSNNQCVLVSGAGSNACSIDANCQVCSYTYSDWSSCTNFQKTRTVTSASPSGCYGTPLLSTSCDPCEGVTCNTPPNNLCYSSSGSCLTGSCSYTMLAAGTSCGVDKVCNTIGECGISQPIDLTLWNDLNSQNISSGESYDTFRAVAYGISISGRQVEFKFYKDELFDNLVATQISTNGYSNIQINNSGDYYFTAQVVGSPAQEIKSPILSVSSTVNNNNPSSLINSPVSGGIYFVNSPIVLQENSSDSDDPIVSEVWTFSDGSTFTGSYGTYSFTTEGQKKIKLKVTDARGAYSEQIVDIIVVNFGVKAFAKITLPLPKQAILSNDLIVQYTGDQSFVVNVSNSGICAYSVTCLAGNCPSYTQNAPNCSSSQNISISSTPNSYNFLEFNWTVRENNKVVGSNKSIGKTTGTFGFANYGTKNISLDLKYLPLGTYTTSSSEFTLFNNRQCSSQGNTWYSVQNGIITGSYNTLNSAYCAGLDNSAGTGDDCCPLGYYCSTSGSVGCVFDQNSEGSAATCEDYTTQQSCNTDASQRVRNDILWNNNNCGEIINGENILCSCSWQASSNSCIFTVNNRDSQYPTGTVSECVYTSQSEQCLNGYQTVAVSATLNSGTDPACVSSTQVLPCGKPVIALPFFGSVQFILSIVGILAIYAIFSRFVSRK
ncbi:MAG TPA: PKD domain-containing protein [Candidatus Nanoarchaeia archaeon]|nr:PKD domain-containing protein [Candidatus Nanoarchaeia archaeon]